MKNLSYLVAAIVISFILGGGALFFSLHNAATLQRMSDQLTALDIKVNPPVPASSTKPLPSSIPAPSQNTPISFNDPQVADWNTYENKQMGFRFKYPKAWDIKALTQDKTPLLSLSLGNPVCDGCDQPPAMTVRVWSSLYNFDTNHKNLNAKSLSELLTKYAGLTDPDYANVKPIQVGKKAAYQADAGPNVFGGGRFVFIPLASGKLIELWFFEIEPPQGAEDVQGTRWSTAILPTFEF